MVSKLWVDTEFSIAVPFGVYAYDYEKEKNWYCVYFDDLGWVRSVNVKSGLSAKDEVFTPSESQAKKFHSLDDAKLAGMKIYRHLRVDSKGVYAAAAKAKAGNTTQKRQEPASAKKQSSDSPKPNPNQSLPKAKAPKRSPKPQSFSMSAGGGATATMPRDFAPVDMRDLVDEVKSLRQTLGHAIATVGKASVKEQRKSRESSEAKFYFWVNATCLGLAIATDLGVSIYQGVQNPNFGTGPLGAVAETFGLANGRFENPVEPGEEMGGYPVTSGYGPREAPTAGASTWHKGVDLGTPIGVALYMPGDGTVKCDEQPDGAGTYATIKPNDSEFTFRAFHLSNCAEGQIKNGQIFAKTGNTGNSTGPHLHWEQWKGEEHVHPTEGWLWWVMTGNPPVEKEGTAINAAGLDDEQKQVIGKILTVARSVGASRSDFEIAIATCLVESNCKELDHGDADSIGAFQQRPSQDWPNTTDTTEQAKAFFKGHGSNVGLLDITGREGNPGWAAQQVQRSAYPDRYTERMPEAQKIAQEILGK